MKPKQTPQATERARQLRHNATHPEKILWNALKNRQLANLKFRRQQPLGKFVLDIYCEAQKLGLELDGNSHRDQAQYDRERQTWIEEQGVRVLRFGNDDVLDNLESVLETVLKFCGIRNERFFPETGKEFDVTKFTAKKILPSPQPSPAGQSHDMGSSLAGEGANPVPLPATNQPLVNIEPRGEG
jgi:very-short-patch-repair endonuclease